MSSPPTSFARRYRWPLIAVAVVLAVAVVGPFVYIQLIKDDPAERLSIDDVTSTTGAGETTTTTGADGLDGTWTATEDSVVQYRVQEVLFGQAAEATGTSEGAVTGTVEISGTAVTAADAEVDMTTFESGESRRDGQFEGRIMEVSRFPTATFTLTAPIELGSVPAAGEEVTVQATGDLTIHGVTNEVTFDLTAKVVGDTFAVNATIPITFSDYGIDDPSGGPASVGDDGELELLLVYGR